MVDFISQWEDRFRNLGRLKSCLLGISLALLISLFGSFVGAKVSVAIALLLYFPAHMWLVLSCLAVVLSREKRVWLLGENWTTLGSFFGRLFSAFGFFCIGFFYALMGSAYFLGLMQ